MPVELPPTVYFFMSLCALILGTCIGSFLNVVIYRVPRDLSVSEPKRSFCPNCKYQIPFYLNIPIVSWLMLRGKCKSCSMAISPRYLGVELLTGLLFLAVFNLTWTPPQANPYMTVPLWILMSLFVAGTFIDIEHFILPDSITLGGAAVGLICSAIVPDFFRFDDRWPVAMLLPDMADRWQCLLTSLFGAAFGYLSIWIIVVLGKVLFGRKKHVFSEPTAWTLNQPEGAPEPNFRLGEEDNPWSDMFSGPKDRLILQCPQASINGEDFSPSSLTIQESGVTITKPDGTVKSIPLDGLHDLSGTCTQVVIPRDAMGMGDVKFMALVGAFLGWKGVLFTIFLGSITGAVLGLLLIAIRGREKAQKLPFGPYLALGATIYLFFGNNIIDWWLGGTLPNRPGHMMVDDYTEIITQPVSSGL